MTIPPKDDLGYILDECSRDNPATQKDLLTRVGAFWDVGWQTVLAWLKVYDMDTKFSRGPRGPYRKAV